MSDNFVINGTVNMGMNVSDVLGGVKQVQSAFNELKMPSNITANMTKDFDKLKEVLAKMRDLSNKQTFSKSDIKGLDKLQAQAQSLFSSIENSYNELNGKQIYLQADWSKIKEAQSELDKLKSDIQNKLSDIKLNLTTTSGGTKAFGMEEIISGMEKGVRSSKVLSAAMQEVKKSLQTGDFSGIAKIFSEIETKAGTLKGAGTGLLDVFKQMGIINFDGPASSLAKTQEGVKLLHTAFSELIKKFPESSAEIQKLAQEFDLVTQKKVQLEATGKANLAAEAEKGASAMRDYGKAADQAAQSTKKVVQSTVDATNQVKQLQQSTQYFFSLRNMINLLKRGVREAVDTVKELDAAMTQTAVVVPEWDVGDMWAKLPEYTKNANALGASVVDLYKATTLYYQQGLRGNDVMNIAAETMKMARIGGLEAADATDKMTAAIRGFNMEVSQKSAQRVNDVYSNLAANTASNTEELGTAMQRTASIAASAGMSFEGTAAFLAQAIETTREPAENLGTAMKTIVARFTELKKNPLEISEVDGEEVSYNKVDTALQSIGVSLKDANGQFRNLDQVFLDISQRWDSLTQTQQRYVATQAAGSRQQSRFIAMMSNYQRTVELMDYANNSAGASQEQFEKTLESFEAKVTKLQNAWHQFLMSITDNHFIKGGVDILTGLIDGVNELINAVSGGFAPLKSFLSLATAFLGLKIGGRFVNGLLGGMGNMVDPTSAGFLPGFTKGLTNRGNPALASQIYTPIVAAIRETNGLNGKNGGLNSPYTTAQQMQSRAYQKALENISDIGRKGGTIPQLFGQFKGLDSKSQRALQNGFSITLRKATQTTFKGYANDFVRQGGKNINDFNNATNAANKLLWNNYRQTGDYYSYGQNIRNPGEIYNAMQATSYKNSEAATYYKNLDEAVKQYASSIVKQDLEKYGSKMSDTQKAKYLDPNGKLYKAAYSRGLTQLANMPQDVKPLTGIEKGLESVGKFGSALTGAGMGLQAFGSVLTQSANPALATFGSALTAIGSVVSGLGMGIGGVVSGFSALTSAIATAASVGTAAAAAIALIPIILGGLLAKAVYDDYKRREKIKEDAEEITVNFNDKQKKSNTNLNNLKTWQNELPRLSKGVDKNGNNINLEDSDYQRYLEIADGIAEINPEIVKGYNAQGHAIIDNNSALQETLALEQKIQKENLEIYTSNDSIKALTAARDLKKVEAGYKVTGTGRFTKVSYQDENAFSPQIDMANQAKELAKTLKDNGFKNKDFKDLGIDLNALEEGSLDAVSVLEKNIDKFINRSSSLLEEAGDKISDDTKEAFNKAIDGFKDSSKEMEELITPTYNALVARMGKEGAFSQIPEEISEFYNQGLKNIASNANLSGVQLVTASRKLAVEFDNLIAKGGDYDAVMEDIAEAQEAFGADLDAEAYQKVADEAVRSLEQIKSGIDSTTSYGQALTEFLDNQITQISHFTEEGVANVTQAINTMSDRISAAEGALETFKAVEEGSNYSTAAKNMQEIYKAVTEKGDNGQNEHAAGLGDQSYWSAAELMFGRENLEGKDKTAVDKMFSSINNMMQDGEKGALAFRDKWISVRTELEKINGLTLQENGWLKEFDSEVNPDVFKEIADVLDMSEDTLTAMLNKARQFVHIDFSDNDAIREGLATSTSTIEGRGFKNGKKALYIKEDTLYAELSQGGISNINDQNIKKNELEKGQNIKAIKSAEEMSKKELGIMFKDMGALTQKSLIQVFGETGEFTKEEIQQYAEKFAEINGQDFDKKLFNNDYNAFQAQNDPIQGEQLHTMNNVDSHVAAILSLMQTERVTSGSLTEGELKGDALKKQIYGKAGNDTATQLFRQGMALDANGQSNLLTRNEYQTTRSDIKNQKTELSNYLEQLKAGRSKLDDGSEEAKLYDKEIKTIEGIIKYLGDTLKAGTEGYQNALNGKIAGINDATGGLLEGKTNKDFKGEKKQNALENLYAAVQEGAPRELTNSFEKTLKTLDIGIEEAFNANLITKESYDKWKKKAKKDQEDQNNAEQQGKDEANAEDKEKKKEQGKKDQEEKNNADQQGRDEAERQAKEAAAAQATKNGEQAQREEAEQKAKEEAARKAKIAAEQRDRENAVKAETAAAEKEKQAEQKKQQQKEAAEKARIAAEQRDKENAEKLANIESNDAFGQYTPEEAQQAGQNLKDWWGKVFNSFKMDTSKNMLGFSSKDIDTSGLDNAAENTEKVADSARGASEELEKDKNSVTSIVAAVTSGLSSVNKGVKTFSQNAQEASSSPSLQGEPKQKGTTVPGVGYVDKSGKVITGNGEAEETPKPDVPSSIDVTVNFKTETSELDAAKASINQIYKKVAKPATVKVKASTGKSMTNAVDKISEVTTAAKKGSGDVKVKADVEGTQDVKNLTAAINKVPKSKVVTVTANTGGAIASINTLRDYASKSVSFTVDVKKGNKRSFNVTVEGKYLGQNNTGIVPQLPSLGSAATGTSKPGTGRLGPKGKGGLTLTGELGYEVAWLPREHRSMILGVKGPEMVNLPGDAVVWNHKQSEQIVKKNAIPSGSAWIGAGSAGGEKGTSDPWEDPNPKNPKKPKKPKKTKDDKDDKDDKKKKNKNKKEILLYDKQEKLYKVQAKLLKKQGKINTWWENISKRIAAAEKIASRNQKRLEKLFSTVGTTKKELDKVIARYGKFLTLQVKLNNQVYNKYNKQLQAINYDENGSNKSRKKTRTKNNSIVKKSNAYNSKMTTLRQQLAAAEETESKKDDKRIKKRIRRLKKKYKDTKKAVKKSAALQTVTWEQDYRITYDTNKKKNRKKNKKVKKSKTYDFSKFIYQDPETGEYLIDYKKINKKGKSKAERKAMKETAEKLVNEKNSRRNDALEKQISANEALEELGKSIYDNLYGWKNELTKIWNITQKIATTEASINKVSSMRSLYETALRNGLQKATDSYIKMGVDYFQGEIGGYAGNVKNAYAAYNTLIDDLLEARNLSETQTLYNQYYSKLNKTTAGKNIMKMAQYEQGSANWEKYQQKALKDKKNYDSAYEDYGVYRQLYNSITARNLANEKYIRSLTTLADGSIEIEIDYAAIEKDRMNGNLTETTYNAVKEYIDNLISTSNDLNEQLESVLSNLQQLNDKLRDLQEEYADYADELLQAYEDQRQAEVDKLEAIYNTLNDHIKDLLDRVKKNLDNRRQQEDNAKTEEDINNKQQRLARLRANTSGGNRAEIAQLEKEIADAQQSYGRTLEDQLLARLEEQADEAAKQRERQIKLLTAQLQLDHIMGVNAAHIDQLLQQIQSQDANERAAAEKEIRDLYNTKDEFGAQTKPRQVVLSNDQEAKIADLRTHDIEEASINAAIEETKGIQTAIGDTIGKLAEGLKGNVPGMPNFEPDEEGEKEKGVTGYEGTFKNIEAIAAQQATLKKTDSRMANQQVIIDTIKGNYSQTTTKIENLQNKNDIIKRKMDKLDPKSKEYKRLKDQYTTNKTRIKDLKDDQKDRIDAIKQHADTISTLENNKREQVEELQNLISNGTTTNFTLEETQGVLEKLGMGLPGEFDGLGDLTAEQSKVISSMSAQQIAELTGLSKVDAEGFRNIVEAISGINLNATVTTGDNGTVTVTGGGLGNGAEGSTKEEVQAKITELEGLVSKYIANRDDQNNKAAKALENRNSLNSKNKNYTENYKKWTDSYITHSGHAAEWEGKRKSAQKQLDEYRKKLSQFASGGFAKFTGPAWLDGTRAKPEAVLSATDTKNFIQLRDVLSTAMKNIPSTENTTYGNTTYDIDVNVERLASDYDVDKVAKRIEKIITKDASYRNVTQVRKFR